MDQLSTAELMELIFLHQSMIDTQVQFWMTATFAIVVASFARRSFLTRTTRLMVCGLYLVATFVFVSRWAYVTRDIFTLNQALADLGVTLAPPWATIFARVVLMAFGTLATLHFVLARSSRQAA